MSHIKKMDLLLAIYIFCIMVSELMGAKTFPIASIWGFKLSASVAIFVFPVIFTITDIVIEVFGKERAHSIILSGFTTIVLLVLFSFLAVSLPPSLRFSTSEKAYDDVFYKSIRISIASLIAFAFSAFFDMIVFIKIRESLGKKALWFRNNISNFASQFSDTVIFITLAFYALDKGFADNASFLIGVIIPYWLLKCSMSVIETPFVYWGVKWLKGEKTSSSKKFELSTA